MATARELGIDELWADLKPEDKIKHVETLEHKYGAMAMVGGNGHINDPDFVGHSYYLLPVAFNRSQGRSSRNLSLSNLVN